MKTNKKLIVSIILIFVIIVTLMCSKMLNKESQEENLIQNEVTVDELKEETGLTGNTDIYEIQEEYDGREVLTVKASLKYKVAFAGMIKNAKPTIEELDTVLNENSLKNKGIWITEDSRDKISKIFNNDIVKSKYIIDAEGYLKIQEKNSQNDVDKKIESLINSDKQIILSISSICYIVDDVTGEILDYNFEKMDKYQTFEYFEDDDKIIVFINENSNNQLTDKEIFNSVIELL